MPTIVKDFAWAQGHARKQIRLATPLLVYHSARKSYSFAASYALCGMAAHHEPTYDTVIARIIKITDWLRRRYNDVLTPLLLPNSTLKDSLVARYHSITYTTDYTTFVAASFLLASLDEYHLDSWPCKDLVDKSLYYLSLSLEGRTTPQDLADYAHLLYSNCKAHEKHGSLLTRPDALLEIAKHYMSLATQEKDDTPITKEKQ